MNASIRLLLAASTLLILTACGNNNTSSSTESTSSTSTGSSTQLTMSVDAYRPPESTTTQESPMKPRDLSAAPTATNIALGAPLASQAVAARKNNATPSEDHMGKPLQIGFGRDVVQTATAAATKQVLKWQTTASSGQVAAINFTSTGAKGIRIDLLVTKLPETATLRFYAKGAATAFEVKGADVLKVLAANLAAGDKSDAGRTYVGPMIRSAEATVEIELPSGVNTNAVELSVPSISHMFMSAQDASTVTSQNTRNSPGNYGLSCQVDVMCETSLPAASDAVAWLIFDKFNTTTNKYETFSCSGTMLNDNLSSGTNYLLTANHCISSQTVASTLYTEFKYRSLSCNTPLVDSYFPTATTGAALLYTASGTDSTLLRLYGAPSTSVIYAGWDATTAPAKNTTVHSIHHPQGDQQRLSRGSISSYFKRSGEDGLSSSAIESGTILAVTQTFGTTETGSSGSGLFKGADTNPQLIGQLFGRLTGTHPDNSCADATEQRVYGRFDMAYNNGMIDYLTQGLKPIFRFFNTQKGTHFFTRSVNERNSVSGSLPQFNYEGPVFSAYSVTRTDLSPVYRFFNTNTGAHFYTINAGERDTVSNTLPQFSYEGIGWYAQTAAGNSAIPLYRFFHKVNGTHFYTVSSVERDSIINNFAVYSYEGIAYYVWP